MQTRPTLGDTLTKGQLHALENGIKADQRLGLPLRLQKQAAKSEIDEIRGRIQWERHKKQAGEWKSKRPYLSQEEANRSYERKLQKREERKQANKVEAGNGIFNAGKGTRTNKRVRDHVGEKNGSYIHVIRFANSKTTIVVKSKK